jgi:hypothetical protein
LTTEIEETVIINEKELNVLSDEYNRREEL